MNVIWIDEKIEKDGKMIKITVRIANFTEKKEKFDLYGDCPIGEIVDTDGEIQDDYVKWHVEIEPVSYQYKKIVLKNASGYGETNYYVDGINPSKVIGAEPLPGDWGIKMDFVEEIEEVEEDEQ